MGVCSYTQLKEDHIARMYCPFSKLYMHSLHALAVHFSLLGDGVFKQPRKT